MGSQKLKHCVQKLLKSVTTFWSHNKRLAGWMFLIHSVQTSLTVRELTLVCRDWISINLLNKSDLKSFPLLNVLPCSCALICLFCIHNTPFTRYNRLSNRLYNRFDKTTGLTTGLTSRLVFTARLRPQFRTPPASNAPSSECPRASIAARRRAAGSIRISIAGIAIGENFKICLLHQFCSNRVDFFTIHRRHRRKKWWTRILKFEFCDFWEFF